MEKTFLRQDSRERTYDKTTQAVHRLRASRHPQTPLFGEETPLFGEGIHMSVAARRIATHGPARLALQCTSIGATLPRMDLNGIVNPTGSGT